MPPQVFAYFQTHEPLKHNIFLPLLLSPRHATRGKALNEALTRPGRSGNVIFLKPDERFKSSNTMFLTEKVEGAFGREENRSSCLRFNRVLIKTSLYKGEHGPEREHHLVLRTQERTCCSL